MRLALPLAFLALFLAGFATAPAERQQDEARVIAARMWHLGDDEAAEWPEASLAPDGTRVDLTFEGEAFEGEGTLVVRQRDVDNAWHVEINGVRVATLDRGEELGERFYPVPAGVVRDGENTFALVGDTPTDDITFGDVRYHPRSFRELFRLRPAVVRVRDASGNPSPARVTITDPEGTPVQVFYAEDLHAAVREGVVYTSDGEAVLEVPVGSYRVYALRGTEWSLAEAELVVGAGGGGAEAGGSVAVELELRRELDTTGFVAADTHIHTLTHSGHGDSSVEERMVTLAGEGVELAIATDHNHNTDYRPVQVALGLEAWFTPVVGNEVSTPIGHFNAFPLDAADEVPAHDLRDVAQIVTGCREKGARAVILNHPRWPDHETGPHGVIALDGHTGDWVGEWAATYDAVELVNSQTEELEPLLLFRDWFALLNRGERVFGVGSSDSHTVGGVVGQGRTYVRSSSDDPAALDVNECADNIAAGRSSISMGILCDVRRGGATILGETLVLEPDALAEELETITLRIQAPSWVRPTEVTLYANGVPLRTWPLADVAREAGKPFDTTLRLDGSDAWPGHDFHLVAVVTGEGVGGPWWPQLNDYTLAATNPVFCDVDGDGVYRSPRALAEAFVLREGTDPIAIRGLLTEVDSAVAAQVLQRVRDVYVERANEAAAALGREALGRHPWLEGWAGEPGSGD